MTRQLMLAVPLYLGSMAAVGCAEPEAPTASPACASGEERIPWSDDAGLRLVCVPAPSLASSLPYKELPGRGNTAGRDYVLLHRLLLLQTPEHDALDRFVRAHYERLRRRLNPRGGTYRTLVLLVFDREASVGAGDWIARIRVQVGPSASDLPLHPVPEFREALSQ